MSPPATATRKHYRTCNLCEAMCGLEIEHTADEILAIRGDADDPFSQGHLCPKAVALQDVWADPDRLRKPVKRVGDDWVEIDWEEALDRVASGLGAIREQHGSAAVGVYLGNPTVHNPGSVLTVRQLLKAIRTPNVFSAASVDQLPHHVAAWEMFGHFFLLPVPDVDRTDFFLVLGANPTASNGSLMTAPGIDRRMAAIRERGGRVLVVDPRRTETAAKADGHFFIRPGTDVLLLLALLRTLVAEGLEDWGRLAEHVDGEDQIFPLPYIAYASRLGETSPWTLGFDFFAQGGMGVDFDNYPPPGIFWSRVLDFFDGVLGGPPSELALF